MKITFYGATKEVTGSCTLVETRHARVLVDCGMFQGSRDAYDKNIERFPFDPTTIDAVIITHAHIDHIGRIPRLMNLGFSGRIFATHPTRLLAKLMWRDAAKVMKEEARRHKGHRMPLYSLKEVKRVFEMTHGVAYGTKVKIGRDLSFEYGEAGHIFGSAFVKVDAEGTSITFSGDVGNEQVPILRDTAPLDETDILVMESTYGNRNHEDAEERLASLARVVKDTVKKKGILLIPAFSLERTQEILYELNSLVEGGALPKVPIFLDSPLAIKVMPVYKQFPEYYDHAAKELKAAGDDFFRFPGLRITKKADESRSIMAVPPPKVIISGSGMMHGGRIMGHLAEYLSDPKTTVMVVGYQAAGTMGRKVTEGVKRVKIDHEEIEVHANVEIVGAYSAHADRDKLLRWVGSGPRLPETIYLNHGEPESMEALADGLKEKYDVEVRMPEFGEAFTHP